MKLSTLRVIALSTVLSFSAIAGVAYAENPMVGGAPMSETKDIIDNAVNSADHTTLVAAVKAAGLVETLEGPGPFTVLAPNNKAFAALPAGTVDSLLEPQNKPTLTAVLTYHVIPGQLSPAEVAGKHKTVEGAEVNVTGAGEALKFDQSGLVCGGVKTANATVYMVDTVLMPPAK